MSERAGMMTSLDPCQLAWQVKKSCWRQARCQPPKKLIHRPGEQAGVQEIRRQWLFAHKTCPPARQAGRGVVTLPFALSSLHAFALLRTARSCRRHVVYLRYLMTTSLYIYYLIDALCEFSRNLLSHPVLRTVLSLPPGEATGYVSRVCGDASGRRKNIFAVN